MSLEQAIPGTTLEEFLGQMNPAGKQNRDYGIEYLTAATRGDFVELPNASKYQLPEYIEQVRIQDSMKSKSAKNKHQRLRKIGIAWTKYSKQPWSIKHLDRLRKLNGKYHFDFLKPTNYQGLREKINGIPFNSPFLLGLAYLTGSVLAGGCMAKAGFCIINKPLDPQMRKIVSLKLNGCLVNKHRYKRNFDIQKAYHDVISLTGMGTGEKTQLSPGRLGVGYLEDLLNMTKNGLLNGQDTRFAKLVLKQFVEGFLDHRLSISKHRTGTITIPEFKNLETSKK